MTGWRGDLTTLRLHAGNASSGEPVLEEVRVEPLSAGAYRIVQSPGLVLGLAAGDVITLHEVDPTRFDIVERGGNLCIQIFKGDGFSVCERGAFERDVQGIGGWLDGAAARRLVFTVPVSVGFTRVEATLNALTAGPGKAEWYYANVYDPADGVTPLDWWNHPPAPC